MTARALLLSGGPHPFEATTPLLARILESAGLEVDLTDVPDDAGRRLGSGGVDVLVCNTLRWRMRAARYDDQRAEHAYAMPADTAAALDGWVRGGGRLLALHGAPVCFDDWPGWGDLLGARWNWERSSHPARGPFTVHVAAPSHPLVAGLADFEIDDECYGFLDHTIAIDALLTGTHGGTAHPLLWEHRPGRGHVVVSLLGHDAESFTHPTHAEILRRAAAHLLRAHPPKDELCRNP